MNGPRAVGGRPPRYVASKVTPRRDGVIEEKSKEHGIALKAAYEGYEGLSAKQRSVFDINVAPHLEDLAEEHYWDEKAASAAP